MSVELPRPPTIRVATVLLVAMTVFSALSAVGTLVLVVAGTALDPTLMGGQLGLALTVTALLFVLGAISTLLPLAGVLTVRSGQRAGLVIGTLLGILWLGSPLFPLGAWLLYVLWGEPETREWFSAMAAARDARVTTGSAAQRSATPAPS